MYNKPRVSSRKPKFRVKKAGKTKSRKALQRRQRRRANNERARALQRKAELRRSRNRQQLRRNMAEDAAREAARRSRRRQQGRELAAEAANASPAARRRRRLTLAGDVNQNLYLPEHIRREMARMVPQPRGFAGRDLSQLFTDPREREAYLTGRRRSANRVRRFMRGVDARHLNIPAAYEEDWDDPNLGPNRRIHGGPARRPPNLEQLHRSCRATRNAREQRLVARHAVRAYVEEYPEEWLYGGWVEAQNEGTVADAYAALQVRPNSYRRKHALKNAIIQFQDEGQLSPGVDRNIRARLLQITGWNRGDFRETMGVFEGKVYLFQPPLPFAIANKAFYPNRNLTQSPRLLQMMPGIPTDANGDIDFLDDMFWPREYDERQIKRSVAKLGCVALNIFGF